MDRTDSKASTEAVMARLDAIDARLNLLLKRQQKTEELFTEMTPILREVMSTATERLDALDKKGYFRFGRELLALTDRVVTGFSPEDVRQLGDSVVGILNTVRALTQPKILQIASEASEVLENADEAEPIGLLGMVRATSNQDVQKGMAVMMHVMRHMGRAAQAVREQHEADPKASQKAKLASVLGPRRNKPLGTERTPAPATKLGPPPACAVPSAKPREAAVVLDGVAFGADGHLVDPSEWTRDLALRIAGVQGIALDASRWAVIDFARADFESTGVAPNIRRITQGTKLTTKDLYTLFPKAPGRTIAKVAGIPKPAGCI